MLKHQFLFIFAFTFLSATLHADTILKFDLGSAGFDFALSGGTLATTVDGDGSTTGDQNTNINYTGFLSGLTDITTDIASFTLSDVALDGSASVVGGSVVVQVTTGGEFKLWDDLNQLLLSGSLTDGTISGALGPAATGSFFNINLDSFTGGSLAPLLDADSLSLAISFTNVNDGAGFAVVSDALQPFQAGGTANIAAFVPEPASSFLLLCGGVAVIGRRRRSRRAVCNA